MKPKLSSRQKQILYYLAKEQVASFEPVGSIQIKEKYDLDFSSATIRHELYELCQMEYLEQPHTSSGRVLSDDGWQIITNDFLSDLLISNFIDSSLDSFDDLNDLAKYLSKETEALSIVYHWETDELYKKGISYILNDKVINNIKDFASISKIVDEIDDKINDLKKYIVDKQINVFIGKDNPLFNNKDLAFIGTKSLADKLIIGVITPKITAYEDHFKTFQKLINSLN